MKYEQIIFKHDNTGICSSNSDGLLASIEIFYSEIKQKLNRKKNRNKTNEQFFDWKETKLEKAHFCVSKPSKQK